MAVQRQQQLGGAVAFEYLGDRVVEVAPECREAGRDNPFGDAEKRRAEAAVAAIRAQRSDMDSEWSATPAPTTGERPAVAGRPGR